MITNVLSQAMRRAVVDVVQKVTDNLLSYFFNFAAL